MKTKYKITMTVVFLLAMLSMAWGTLLLEENFDYPAGDLLTAHGWGVQGVATPEVAVVSGGLSYPGYQPVVGNAAGLGVSGQDVNKSFTAQTSGTIYSSFLINLTSATTTGDYLFLVGPATIGTSFYGRVFVKRDATNNVSFGISYNGALATALWTTATYALNTTYLIVVKYEVVTGTANDVVSLFVNPAFPGTEPAALQVFTNTGTDAVNIGSVGLRQGGATAAPACKIDGIRVAATWADLFPSGTLNPVIHVTGTMTPFDTIVGSPTASQSYTLSGTDLSQNISVTAPVGYELSTINDDPWTSTLSLASSFNGLVYVRFNPSSGGTFNGNIVHTSGTAPTVNLAVTGSATMPASSITVDVSSLTFNTVSGTPSAIQQYNLFGTDLTDLLYVQTSAPFEIRTAAGGSWVYYLELAPDFNDIMEVRYNPTAPGTDSGTILHYSSFAADVNINLSGTAATPYSITATPTSLTFTGVVGTPSAAQSYNLHGANLTESIVVTAPTAYEVSSTSATGPWTSTVTVANTFNNNIYVRYNPTAPGSNNGNITNVANGITTNVALTGTATMPVTPLVIQVGQTVSQNFDIIGAIATATLPTDWKVDKLATVDTRGTWTAALSQTNYVAGNAMSTTASNGIYNYGAGDPALATDRAVGFLSSGSATKTGNLYARLTNIGATTITSFDVTYTAEKYRMGTNTAGFGIKLYYSLDGAVWTYAGDALKASWIGDTGTNAGYTPAPGAILTVTGTVVASVPQSSVVYLCWSYGVSSGSTTTNAQALAIDDVTIFASANPITQAPVFSVIPGLLDGPTTVSITCATPGSSIYYTTNGVDPTNASTLYNSLTPVQINATTTLKAIAYATGYDESPITTGVYTIPINVANIAALRALTPGTGTVYKLNSQGVLTLKSNTVINGHVYYIQDATGAIQIYDATGIITTTYNLGDGITGIVGTILLYNGMLEIVPAKNTAPATSTGNVVTPVNVTLANLDTTYQAKLVRITDVTVTGTGVFGGSPAAKVTYPISDPTGTGVLRTEYIDLDYVGVTEIPTTPSTYVGIALQYQAVTQLVPRSAADITSGSTLDAPINVTVLVAGNNVDLFWGAVTGATGYIIQASDTPGGTYSQIGTSTIPFFNALGDAAVYGKRFYKVIATN